jgi:hypothetical protein
MTKMERSDKAFLLGVGLVLVSPLILKVYIDYAWRDTTPVGPLSVIADWPEPIRDIHRAIEDADLDVTQFQVCLLRGKPGWVDSTAVCRVPLSALLLTVVATALDLKTIPSSDATRIQSEVNSRVSGWWPTSPVDVEYFACSHSLAGGEGPLYVVAVDSKSNKLYIHYHFNF